MGNRAQPHSAVFVAADDSDTVAYVRITGDVDTATGPDLAAALERLAELAGRAVYIDMTDTTSAGATLLTFLARVATTIAPHATWLYRPSATARHMIELAGVDALTAWCDELPGGGVRPPDGRAMTAYPRPGSRCGPITSPWPLDRRSGYRGNVVPDLDDPTVYAAANVWRVP